jgi:hypothetical protein
MKNKYICILKTIEHDIYNAISIFSTINHSRPYPHYEKDELMQISSAIKEYMDIIIGHIETRKTIEQFSIEERMERLEYEIGALIDNVNSLVEKYNVEKYNNDKA